MRNRKVPTGHNAFSDQKASPLVWNVILWVLAMCAFAATMVQSYRATHETPANDLRTPAVLLLDALLATAVAFGYAVREGSLTRLADVHLCFRFGLWSAAVFRLLPPMMNEQVLFYRNMGTFDAPYVVLGACIHGGLAVLLAWPCAGRVLYPEGRPLWAGDESLWEMGGAAILIFYIVTAVVRLVAAFAR